MRSRLSLPRATAPAALLAITLAAPPALAEPNGPMLAQACAGCHGQSGSGAGAIVDIRGYDRDAFLRTWEEFRTDQRSATIMNRIARGYTELEAEALADYFATLD